ncbi:hypothetical protein PE36_03144 [Moritella sp. PE36]|uniref:hypothetical protein n=1 Tax=Moritella sp. PE36 TaxID=58051 RepID=UPI00015699D7|nr:hypothetical protein [Moritella sp. PE36]EDM66675.1 hypothetical protein PE36_03144 [Moritella sp. PE36]
MAISQIWTAESKLAVIIENWLVNRLRTRQLFQKKVYIQNKSKANLVLKKHKLIKDLRRKEKALVETAALLVLRKKLSHLNGLDEES